MGDPEPSQVGIVLQYQESMALYQADVGLRSLSTKQLQDLAQPSKEIISLENKIRAIDPEIHFQREKKILRPSRPGAGFDGIIYGEFLCTVLIPLTMTAPIVVPLVKAWLERRGQTYVEIKLEDGTIKKLKTQGLTIKQIQKLLQNGQDDMKKNEKQEAQSPPQVKKKP